MEYDQPTVIEEQVTDGEAVYDVSIVQDGQQLVVEARYNSDATAEQYETVEDVHGTGPVMEVCRDTIRVIGTPPDPEEIRDDIDEYFSRLKDAYWDEYQYST